MDRELEPRNFIDLPPALLEALGVVSARYGQIEYLLAITIHRTSGVSYDEALAKVEKLKRGHEIRKEVKREFKEWAIEEFQESEGKRRSDEFNDLINEWANVADRRHDVVHCCWTVGAEDGQLTGTRKGALLTKASHPLSIKDVQDLGGDMNQIVFRLNMATKLSWRSDQERSLLKIIPPSFTSGFELPSNLETTATAVSFMPGSIVKPSDD